jgi:hypothetical protein
MNNIWVIPSFYSHALNGFLMLLAVVLLYRNYPRVKGLEPYKQITLALLFAMAIGIHGLSHLGLEYVYGFNPMQPVV